MSIFKQKNDVQTKYVIRKFYTMQTIGRIVLIRSKCIWKIMMTINFWFLRKRLDLKKKKWNSLCRNFFFFSSYKFIFSLIFLFVAIQILSKRFEKKNLHKHLKILMWIWLVTMVMIFNFFFFQKKMCISLKTLHNRHYTNNDPWHPLFLSIKCVT